MAIIGQRAAVLCSLGDNLIYSVPSASTDQLTISFSSVDNSPITIKVYHVKQGNSGALPHSAKDLLASPLIIDTTPVFISELNVSSLDDIVVNSSVDVKLVVNINGGL